MKGFTITELIEENEVEDYSIHFISPDGRVFTLDSLSISPNDEAVFFHGKEIVNG